MTCLLMRACPFSVIPAQAGIHAAFPYGGGGTVLRGADVFTTALSFAIARSAWIPAFAGMTGKAGITGRIPVKQPYVYILASRPRGTLYTGVTSDLCKRVSQHRSGVVDGFTKKYGVKRLVWFEPHGSMESAILREKQIKKWNRRWKIALIAETNPEWLDLFGSVCGTDG